MQLFQSLQYKVYLLIGSHAHITATLVKAVIKWTKINLWPQKFQILIFNHKWSILNLNHAEFKYRYTYCDLWKETGVMKEK